MMQSDRRLVLGRARDDVRSVLRDMILGGEIADGARLEEVELAARLGVSRTPIREALIALERDGLVRSRPHRGFVVAAADAAMVRETYPILAALEIAAMKSAWPRVRAAAAQLRDLNERLRSETSATRQYELDHGFHAALTEACENGRLRDLLEVERTRAKRFDGAELRGMADHAGSCSQHARVLAAIENDRPEEAGLALEEHWKSGIEVVTRWLAQST